jgi:hypothetical protein
MKNAFICITLLKTNEYVLDINSKYLDISIIEFDKNKINLLNKARNFVEQNQEKFDSDSFFDGIFLSSSLVNRINDSDWDYICGRDIYLPTHYFYNEVV